MTTFKVRNNILAAGGLTIPSGATLTNSGSIVNSGSQAFGSTGTTITSILYGTVTITCPSATASNTGANTTATVANLQSGAKLFVTAGSIPQGFVLVAASATAASTITASFLNSTAANISSSALVTLQYLAIS